MFCVQRARRRLNVSVAGELLSEPLINKEVHGLFVRSPRIWGKQIGLTHKAGRTHAECIRLAARLKNKTIDRSRTGLKRLPTSDRRPDTRISRRTHTSTHSTPTASHRCARMHGRTQTHTHAHGRTDSHAHTHTPTEDSH